VEEEILQTLRKFLYGAIHGPSLQHGGVLRGFVVQIRFSQADWNAGLDAAREKRRYTKMCVQSSWEQYSNPATR